MKIKFRAIVTIGPAVIDREKLKAIDSLGECIFRINGAHSDVEQASNLTEQVRKVLPKAQIMIDLPGNKIRTINLSEPIRLIKGESFILHDYEVNYPGFFCHIKKGNTILANDSIFVFEVIEARKDYAKFLSYSDGFLISNKGLHIKGVQRDMPFLFPKDRELIDFALLNKLDFLSLSFVRSARDISEVRNLLRGSKIHIIAKIETHSAIRNLNTIFKEVNSILVDRGDLSAEIGILNVARAQEEVVEQARRARKNVYLATQFLKNMENKPVPLIPEVIDLCRTMQSGINGIQLSEETAVGKYPYECVKLIFDIHKNINKD